MSIRELKLYTPQLASQIRFYTDVLQLPLESQSDTSVTFKLGKSKLCFEEKKGATPYHFAFNIPCNKINEAHAWLKERVEVLTMDGNEIQDFESWNAKAVYFYDVDQNIVELIARKNLNNESNETFSQNLLLEISEIGIPTSHIETLFTALNSACHLPKYDGDFDRFCAIGDETGLFICLNKNVKGWFPLNDKAWPSNFEVKIEVNGEEYGVEYRNEKINTITTKSLN